jgi:hypothetical protein
MAPSIRVLKNALRHGVEEQRMMADDVPEFCGMRYPAAAGALSPRRLHRLAANPILEHASNLPRQRHAVKHIVLGFLISEKLLKAERLGI